MSMILLLHILIAITSVTLATLLVVSPSRRKLRTSYGLIAATLISGTALVISEPAQMLHSCMMGLIYIVIVSALTAASRNRLIALEAETTKRS